MARDMEMVRMGEIISETSDLAYRGRWVAIEQLLDDIDYTESTGVLMCWVRATVPMREKLYNWQNTVYKIKDEIDRRGEKSEEILQGLL